MYSRFLQQDIAIEKVVQLCAKESHDTSFDDLNLPVLMQTVQSMRTPQTMAAFLLTKLPYEYQHVS